MIRALAIVALLVGVAQAENPSLAKARDAIDGVRYDDAKSALDLAAASGTLEAKETAEVYRLLGNTLAVMGQAAAAENAYGHYLALDPQAELPTTAPAKQQRPFQAARGYITANGPLEVAAVRNGATIEVTIKRNPYGFARSAGLAAAKPSVIDGAPVVLPADPNTPALVIVRDGPGNALLEIEVPVGRAAPSQSQPPAAPQPSADTSSPPLYRNWIVWALPAVALGAVGTYFVFDARDAQDDLTTIAGTHGEFFASEFAEAESRRNRSRLVAGVLLGGATACAVTAVVMLATTPERTVIAPTANANGAGVVFHTQF